MATPSREMVDSQPTGRGTVQEVGAVLAQRDPIFGALADVTLEVSELGREQAVDALRDLLEA